MPPTLPLMTLAMTLLSVEAIMTHWIRHFGPMEVLVADGETGLVSEEVAQFLDRVFVQLKPKLQANTPRWWSDIMNFSDVPSFASISAQG